MEKIQKTHGVDAGTKLTYKNMPKKTLIILSILVMVLLVILTAPDALSNRELSQNLREQSGRELSSRKRIQIEDTPDHRDRSSIGLYSEENWLSATRTERTDKWLRILQREPIDWTLLVSMTKVLPEGSNEKRSLLLELVKEAAKHEYYPITEFIDGLGYGTLRQSLISQFCSGSNTHASFVNCAKWASSLEFEEETSAAFRSLAGNFQHLSSGQLAEVISGDYLPEVGLQLISSYLGRSSIDAASPDVARLLETTNVDKDIFLHNFWRAKAKKHPNNVLQILDQKIAREFEIPHPDKLIQVLSSHLSREGYGQAANTIVSIENRDYRDQMLYTVYSRWLRKSIDSAAKSAHLLSESKGANANGAVNAVIDYMESINETEEIASWKKIIK
ncbi:MAG: hypothetical protein ACJAXZ_000490 [Akkermansiaceae bacterium]